MDQHKPPHVENAPGLTWRLRKGGWEARWRVRPDLGKRGYTPKNVRLWIGWEPNDAERAWISDRCNVNQTEMLVWGRGGLPQVAPQFDGSIKGLVVCYQTGSPYYRELRYHTRRYYDRLCRRLVTDHGDDQVETVRVAQLLSWHKEWSAGGKVAMGHAMMTIVRILFGYGATFLEDDQCARVAGVLRGLKFKNSKRRKQFVTADQAIAIRAEAHKVQRPSVALAQALQFGIIVRQKDVIGEWVPVSESGTSDVIDGNEKWLRGFRWNEIDDSLVLRHTTSKRGKDLPDPDLKLEPMIIEELNILFPGIAVFDEATKNWIINRSLAPSSGPIVVDEETKLPYTDGKFRALWREIATAVGLPKKVYNMDSRSGGITEATTAGAPLEHVQQAATHSDIATTQGYSRGEIAKAANVARLRVQHRNKSGTDGGGNAS